jgi:hypothetical protein
VFLDAADRHAIVFGLEDDHHAAGGERVFDRGRDGDGRRLLRRRPSSRRVDDPGEFREAAEPLPREVADVSPTMERE